MPVGRPPVVIFDRDHTAPAFRTEPSPVRLELEMLLGVKKGVHLQLKADTHVELRRIMVERGLTMQSIFEEFAQRVIMGDEYTESLMETVLERRAHAAVAASRADTDALLSVIGHEPAQVVQTDEDET